MIIDAHVHLWEEQRGLAGDLPVISLGGGRSSFLGKTVQMLPPYMEDGKNTIERFVANMDYAGVNAAVVTQEIIDGKQNDYLRRCKEKYPDRLKICSLFEEGQETELTGFDGLKICSGRLEKTKLNELIPLLKEVERRKMFLSLDLAEGAAQVGEWKEIIQELPELRIAIGHFGMANRKDWTEQILLARHPNVFIESGGITWLFHKEFYPYPSAMDAIREAAQICGMDKLMWGSDYPRTMTAITYRMSYDFILKSDQLSVEEKKKFLGENAMNFYGFGFLQEITPIKNMLEE